MIFSDLANNTLWLCVMRSDSLSSEHVAQCYDLLSNDERKRNARFRFERDRRRDLLARTLLRSALGEYVGEAPKALRFARTEKGKPFLSHIPSHISAEQLHFNLSHAENWVVLAIAKQTVGVDIEYTLRKNDVLAIADRYFYGNEIKQLFSYPQAEQYERFFDYWTLKESYMKARGEGISLGLDNFGFQLASSSAISLTINPCLNDDPAAWKFSCFTPFEGYRLALAMKSKIMFSLAVEEFFLGGERQIRSDFNC